jgi:phosphinothricin acetyltransferase
LEYEIREMKEDDWEDVARIYQDGLDTHVATFQTSCPTYEEWDKAHLKICRFVITQDGKVAGWTALSPVSSRCVYGGVAELSIYMDGKYRKSGLGTKLLGHLIHESEKAGIWMLQSAIIQENLASLNLHRKCGFRNVGYREKIAKDYTGVWRNTVMMEKRSCSSIYN